MTGQLTVERGRTRRRFREVVIALAVGTAIIVGLPHTPAYAGTIPFATSSSLRWQTYVNERYGYTLDYPAARVTGEKESDSGDGRVFRSPDATVRVLVWATYNVMEDDVPGLLSATIDKRTATLKRITSDGFVVSGYTAGKTRIWYHRVRIVGDTVGHLEIEYPTKQKTGWDPIVTRMSASFNLPKG